ncbi:MAG: hypothetical protein JXA46_19205 [Dehalococcoidales bacterium]|nr:hypothetical protein [Dehalococcoidales bacterium]
MELTYDNMVNHMNTYFADYNRYGGDPKTLPNMLKYYTPDIRLHSYNPRSEEPLTLQKILEAMTHPGLHEEFTPNYYVVDEQRKVVVVQMQNQFTEEAINKSYPPKQLSVHYHMVQDENGDIKFNKILFFAEASQPEEGKKILEMMRRYFEKSRS